MLNGLNYPFPFQIRLMFIKLWIWMINTIVLVLSPNATLSEAVIFVCFSISKIVVRRIAVQTIAMCHLVSHLSIFHDWVGIEFLRNCSSKTNAFSKTMMLNLILSIIFHP